MSESIQREKEIFEQALVLPPGPSRDRFLLEACGQNEFLRHQIEELCQVHGRHPGFLPYRHGEKTPNYPGVDRLESSGSIIGPYKLLQLIGDGGMGVVYMAEQEKPIRRRVALKILKLGMDTREVVARFEAERQALALMDHPNIAKIFDGGATDSGRPYFVMELVQGAEITEFCAKNRLEVSERIRLFIAVCHAIQSAHQKGIIHRDIKPSNVLVTHLAGVAVPKVIDFGVAKATNQRLTEKTLFTRFATMIGTPAYMSPEQAEMSNLDVDTRADIYSLGVLLYELLTGSTPFSEERLRHAGQAEMQRIIAQEEPERPSVRLGTRWSHWCEGSTSSEESGEAKKRRFLANDLDWIVMKCLEKDPARRYETVSSLALDLQRHLDDEPILARPPSRLYRFQKLLRRNKLVVGATATVGTVLLLGAIFSSVLALRATRAEAEQSRLTRSEAQQRRQATINESKARQAQARAEAQTYVSDMNLVQRLWDEGNLKSARARIARHFPTPGERDRRGFEWRYLWSLCQDESAHAFTNLPGAVSSLACSPNGQVLAASTGPAVKLFDLTINQEVGSLPIAGTNGSICALAFSPISTNLMASASTLGMIEIWDTATNQKRFAFTNTGGVGRLAFSADGKKLAAASRDVEKKTLSVWDFEQGKLLWERTCPMPPNDAKFSPDGRVLVSGGGGGNGNALVWEVATGAELNPFEEHHKGLINSIAFAPNGRTLATSASDGRIILWDFAERKPIGPPRIHGGADVAFSADGRLLGALAWDDLARVWDLTDNGPPGLLRGHMGGILALVATLNGKSFITSGADQAVRVWPATAEPRDGNALGGHRMWVNAVAFSIDGKIVASVDFKMNTTKIWDVVSRQHLQDLNSGVEAPGGGGVAFSPNGKIFATSSYTGVVDLWDRITFRALRHITNDFGGASLAFSNDGTVLALTSGYVSGPHRSPISLAFWDVETGNRLNRLAAAGHDAASVAFSRDGRHVAVGYASGRLKLWDWSQDDLIGQFDAHVGQVPTVAFSPDGSLLASGSTRDETLVICEVPKKAISKRLDGHIGGIRCVAFAPDGKTLAAAGNDGSIRLWNLETFELALLLRKHTAAVTGVDFTSDGKLMVSCDGYGQVRLWPAVSFEEIEMSLH